MYKQAYFKGQYVNNPCIILHSIFVDFHVGTSSRVSRRDILTTKMTFTKNIYPPDYINEFLIGT